MAALLAQGVWDRKAGRYDFDRFDHLASTSASVGCEQFPQSVAFLRSRYILLTGQPDQSVGKVGVDCRFHFRKSHWGTLGPAENAAGIIYMEINFDQPRDCTLKSAKVQVTLDEDDQGLDPYRVDTLPPSECPVMITDYYGPGHIVGTSKRVQINKSLKIEPCVNVAGNGGSLGGKTTEKRFEHESRWMFRSHRVPDNTSRRQRWSHRIIQWEMTENDIEEYPVHSNKVFTAFAYEHSGQPFLMKVEVSGKLKQRGDQLRANVARSLRKFGPRARRQEDISTTLVGAYLGHRRPLDELAKGLANAMEMQNCLVPPLVVPDTQMASFQQVAYGARVPTNVAVECGPTGTSNPASIEGRASEPGLTLNGQTLDMLTENPVIASQDRTEPTLENLARVAQCFLNPVRQDALRSNTSEASSDSSATTLMANRPGTPQSTALVPRKVDGDDMARVMDFAFLRLFIRFVVGIMGFFEPRRAPENATSGRTKA